MSIFFLCRCLSYLLYERTVGKMNLSGEQEDFEMSCEILGKTYSVITKLPSNKFLINHIFAIALNGILIIPTILLNAVPIITILKSSQLNSKPCYFIILIQCVNDLAVGIFGMPLFLVYLASGIGGNSNCIAATLAFRAMTLPMGLSTFTVFALTLERYIAILHPYAYKTQVTKRRLLIYVCIAAVVMFSLIIVSSRNKIRTYVAIVLEILIFFFIAFAYTKIYLVVKKLARSENRPHDAAAQNLTRMKLFLREIKQAKSCFIVVICFGLLCLIPVVIAFPFFQSLDKYNRLAISIWIYTLFLLNSSVNSLIFFWTKTMLRKEAAKLMNTMCLH